MSRKIAWRYVHLLSSIQKNVAKVYMSYSWQRKSFREKCQILHLNDIYFHLAKIYKSRVTEDNRKVSKNEK